MAGDTPFAPDTTDASGVALPEPRLTTLRIGRVEAADFARDPRNGRDDTFHVMAANYDPNGEAGEFDGITAEDIVTATREDGTIDLDILGSWGPFELWYSGAYAPIAANIPTTAAWTALVATRRAISAAAYGDPLPADWVTLEHSDGARFTASPSTHAAYDAAIAAGRDQ